MLLLGFLPAEILTFLTGPCEKKYCSSLHSLFSVFICVKALTAYRGWAYMINRCDLSKSRLMKKI
jgi:hypothetical protein